MNKLLTFRIGVAIVAFYSFVFLFSQVFQVSLDDVKVVVESFGIFAPIVYSLVLLLGLTIPFNPVSDFLIVNVAALLFTPFVSIVFTFIAHAIALTINYNLGKKYGSRVIDKIGTEKQTALEKYIKKLSVRNLFLLRFFLPTSNVVGVEILSYISGYRGMPFKKFFIVSIIPWSILNVIYFTATSFVRDKSLSLYFIPAIIIIGLPLVLYFVFKNLSPK